MIVGLRFWSWDLSHAISEQKTSLTHNRSDFERLATVFNATQNHHGIIIAARHDVHELMRRFVAGLESDHGWRNGKPSALHKSWVGGIEAPILENKEID